MRRVVLLGLLAALGFALAVGIGAGAARPGRAGIVVKHGDGRVVAKCVEFTEDKITGEQLLKRSGLKAVLDSSSGMGSIVCNIDGEGTNYPAEACFAQCQGPPCIYWRYFGLQPGDTWMAHPLGASSRTLRDGDVDAWVWGGDDVVAPAITFKDICPDTGAAPAPAPAQAATPAPAVTPTAPPAPTATPVPPTSPPAPAVTPVPPTPTRSPALPPSLTPVAATPSTAEAETPVPRVPMSTLTTPPTNTPVSSPTTEATATPAVVASQVTATAAPTIAAVATPTKAERPSPLPTPSPTVQDAGSLGGSGSYLGFGAVVVALVGVLGFATLRGRKRG